MAWTKILAAFQFATLSIASPLKSAQRTQLVHRTTSHGRSDGSSVTIAPKFFIVSLFTPEAIVWQEAPSQLGLGAINVTIPGLSPLFPTILCNKDAEVCQIVTGEGEINAGPTMTALYLSHYFDLRKTYFLIAGIAGINPACGTIGGVSIARYAVQVGLEYLIDPRELTANYTSRAGFIPLGATAPNAYPGFLYGSEVFELSRQYRKAPANQPPTVFQGDVVTSDPYFHGKALGDSFGKYVSLLTNGTGKYCMSAQEDNAILESLLRAHLAGYVDFPRIMLMRTAANFDRPFAGEMASTQLFYDTSGGFAPSTANIFNAGILILRDIVKHWKSEYEMGLKQTQYYGDVLRSIQGQAFPPNIGPDVSVQG